MTALRGSIADSGHDVSQRHHFAIHPAGGLGWCYAGLLPVLPRGIGLYALQAAGPDLPQSLTAVAPDYPDTLDAVAPTGPTRPLGRSLAGDAAVGMHPVTAHGFNFGLYGVDALARALSAAADPGAAAALARYDAEHRRTTLPIYLGTNAMVRLFTDCLLYTSPSPRDS